NREGVCLSHDHAPPPARICKPIQRLRKAVGIRLQDMVFYYVFHLMEPEKGELIQHLPFVGYAVGQYDIEGGHAVRDHDEKPVVKVVYVAHFPFFRGTKAGEIGLQEHAFFASSSSFRRRCSTNRADASSTPRP